ncbi:MAG: hypothetical protein PHF67_03460 [Candidatus Nanoarchaeia archaeon]|nr:hypothetical protein [Candidatus Nanoarchaeia archaeon]
MKFLRNVFAYTAIGIAAMTSGCSENLSTANVELYNPIHSSRMVAGGREKTTDFLVDIKDFGRRRDGRLSITYHSDNSATLDLDLEYDFTRSSKRSDSGVFGPARECSQVSLKHFRSNAETKDINSATQSLLETARGYANSPQYQADLDDALRTRTVSLEDGVTETTVYTPLKSN